jgi:hypothetical protein
MKISAKEFQRYLRWRLAIDLLSKARVEAFDDLMLAFGTDDIEVHEYVGVGLRSPGGRGEPGDR